VAKNNRDVDWIKEATAVQQGKFYEVTTVIEVSVKNIEQNRNSACTKREIENALIL